MEIKLIGIGVIARELAGIVEVLLT